MSDGRASKDDDDRPDLKWVVEWLVEREGQRKTAALLDVNRKTVALALRRERLTGRMNLAVRRLMSNLDDPEWERTTPVDRLEARIQVALEAVHELAALVEQSDAARGGPGGGTEARRRRRGPGVGGCARRRRAGPAPVQLEAEASAAGRGKERWMSRVRWVTKAEAVREMEVSRLNPRPDDSAGERSRYAGKDAGSTCGWRGLST